MAAAEAEALAVTIVISWPREEVQSSKAKGGSPDSPPRRSGMEEHDRLSVGDHLAASKEVGLVRSDSFDDYEQCSSPSVGVSM